MSSNMTMAPNWSPPMRASVSPGLSSRPSRRATASSAESPNAMPSASLTSLKRSTSIASAAGVGAPDRSAWTIAAPSRSKNNSRLGRPVRLSWIASWRMRSSAVLISVTSDERADDADHLALRR